jgi:large conductance mechanosensitive channel
MAEKTTTKKTTKVAAARARAAEKARAARQKAANVKGAGGRHANGFIEFIRTQGVIGLAVGLAIGTAAGDTVKKLVEGFITPFVQLLVGSQKGLEAATWTLDINGRTGDFKWGAFVSSAITLLATALVIYLIIHFAKLDRLDKKKES